MGHIVFGKISRTLYKNIIIQVPDHLHLKEIYLYDIRIKNSKLGQNKILGVWENTREKEREIIILKPTCEIGNFLKKW